MDPAAVVGQISQIYSAIKTLVDEWQNKQVVGNVEEFMGTLELMMAVLKERKTELVSVAGYNVLTSISKECSSIKDSIHTFRQNGRFVRFVTGSDVNMKAQLEDSRVKLQEYMALYTFSMSPAGSSPAADTRNIHDYINCDRSARDPSKCSATHLKQFYKEVAVMQSADAELRRRQHQRGLEKQRPLTLSESQELELCSLVKKMRTEIVSPPDVFTGNGVQHLAVAGSNAACSAGASHLQEVVPDDALRATGSCAIRAKIEEVQQSQVPNGLVTVERTVSELTSGDNRAEDTCMSSLPRSRRKIELAEFELSHQPATHIVQKTVCTADVQIETWDLCAAPIQQRWDLQQAGTTVCGVTLALPEDGQLYVQDGNQLQGTWRDVVIEGKGRSNIVIIGKMVLDRVTFISCTLVAIDGAELSATDCCFINCRVAAMATGANTKAIFKYCTIKECESGIVAVHGGRVHAQKCTVRGGTTGLLSSVAGSCIEATDCEVSECNGNCADVRQGARLVLKQCSLKHSKEGSGVNADGRLSIVELDSCVVASNHLHGVLVQNYAVLYVRASGQIDMQQSTVFSGNRLANVLATTRADVQCWACNIFSESVTDDGMVADGWGTRITVKNCTLEGSMQRGVVAQNQAHFEGVQLVVSGTTEAGVWVCTAATSKLSEVTVSECAHGSGVHVHGDQSSVTIERSVVHGNSVGMKAEEGAEVTANHVQTWSNARAGVVIDKFSTVLLESCTCQDATPYKTPWNGGRMTRRNCKPA